MSASPLRIRALTFLPHFNLLLITNIFDRRTNAADSLSPEQAIKQAKKAIKNKNAAYIYVPEGHYHATNFKIPAGDDEPTSIHNSKYLFI
jgi:hypothetical protein